MTAGQLARWTTPAITLNISPMKACCYSLSLSLEGLYTTQISCPQDVKALCGQRAALHSLLLVGDRLDYFTPSFLFCSVLQSVIPSVQAAQISGNLQQSSPRFLLGLPLLSGIFCSVPNNFSLHLCLQGAPLIPQTHLPKVVDFFPS